MNIKTLTRALLLGAVPVLLPLMTACGDDDNEPDNPSDPDIELPSVDDYNPDDDCGLRQYLRKFYGQAEPIRTDAQNQSKLIGKWVMETECAEWYHNCMPYMDGFIFEGGSNPLAYYLDENMEVDGNGHSWHLENDGDRLSIYWFARDNDRYWIHWTNNGKLILVDNGFHWHIYKKVY